jgi:ubiquinone biosynthesis protein UbiJ
MEAGVVSALITGVLALIGVVVTNVIGNSKVQASLDKAQAVTETKLENLKEEVAKHNRFGERIPAIETKVENLEKRVEKLEG